MIIFGLWLSHCPDRRLWRWKSSGRFIW